jgi:ribonucleoside-diphosphate reductase alpha chain
MTALQTLLSDQPLITDDVYEKILKPRYFQPGETSWACVATRVVDHIMKAERLLHPTYSEERFGALRAEFLELITSQRLMPSSPILFNAGTGNNMLSACTGTVLADDSIEAIMQSVTECATLTADGAGVGVNITPLRWNCAPLSRKGVASGACSWLALFDAVGQTIRQGGRNRRAALIALLHIEHPDVIEFIHIKDDLGKLNHMNISLQITDEFMRAVAADDWWQFRFPVSTGPVIELPVSPKDMDGRPDKRWAVFQKGVAAGTVDAEVEPEGLLVKRVRARWLFDMISEHAWKSGEPGMMFLDAVNRQNPLPDTAPVLSTNPCGEVPLFSPNLQQLGYPDVDNHGVPIRAVDSCNLAHAVLPRFLVPAYDESGTLIRFDFNWVSLAHTVRAGTRFLDDVVEINTYRPAKIGDAVRATRRNGLGVIGLADVLILLGMKYGHPDALAFTHRLWSWIEYHALDASADLAQERGSFPLFEGSRYQTEGLAFRDFPYEDARPGLDDAAWAALDAKVRCGLRHSTVTTCAPTGSVSELAGQLSNSIEPIFFLNRRRRTVDGHVLESHHWSYEAFLNDELPDYVRMDLFVTAHEVHPTMHVGMQLAAQAWIGTAVSKTVNLPHDADEGDVRLVYQQAWRGGAKGVTVYRDGSRDLQPVSNAAVTSPAIQLGALASTKSRPRTVSGRTHKVALGASHLYITINHHEQHPVEVMLSLGKAGSDQQAKVEAIGRLISNALKYGVPPEVLINTLKGIGGASYFFDHGYQYASVPDAVGQVLEREMVYLLTLGPVSTETQLSTAAVDNAHLVDNPVLMECPACHKHTYYKESGCGKCLPVDEGGCGFSRCF